MIAAISYNLFSCTKKNTVINNITIHHQKAVEIIAVPLGRNRTIVNILGNQLLNNPDLVSSFE